MTVPENEVSRGIGLGPEALAALAPFHLVWDGGFRVLQVGDVLGRLVPELLGGCRLTDCFVIRRPRGAESFEDLLRVARDGRPGGRLTLLESVTDERLALRGQLVALEGVRLLFFGSPVANDLAALTALGLTLQDFAVHDGVADFLMVKRSLSTALADANQMAAELARFNGELEERVGERTSRLLESNEELARHQSELEHAHALLKQETAERQRVEEDLRLAHKLEAVGQLAAGIAHELNTPVQFVGDNVGFLEEVLGQVEQVVAGYAALAAEVERAELAAGADLDPRHLAELARLAELASAAREAAEQADLGYLVEEGRRAVAESLEGTARVGEIVRAMREFAHPDRADLVPADLNQCVETTLAVSRNEYRDVADVVTELDPDLPPVPCLPGEVNQVLLNLFVNAAHAIADRPDGGRGTIRVRTGVVDQEVQIRVQDDGPGIPVEIQARIFDPFFTTKEVGRGIGQGLSTSRAIVTQRHHGRLTFSSMPGWTEFVIALPLNPPA